VLLDTQKQATFKNVNVHKTVGENVGFERTRRITGYLVGTLDRFNNAKRAEERDRVKHTTE
jgi:anaerobic ribonucleoside-triphosphate reductase